jgi:hypothetical protein
VVLVEHVHEDTEGLLVIRRVVQGADPHVRFPLTGIRIEPFPLPFSTAAVYLAASCP